MSGKRYGINCIGPDCACGAPDAAELMVMRRRMMSEMSQTQFQGKAETFAWNRKLNARHDGLIRAAVLLAEQELREQGAGAPPVAYAFAALGSAGREEMTLGSDQDHAILYRTPEPELEAEAERYFRIFAERIGFFLRSAGYPPCPGNVLCTNPQWRKPADRWTGMLKEWMADPTFDHIRYLLMIADMRCMCGDDGIVEELRAAYMSELRSKPGLFRGMLENTLRRKAALGPFGNLLLERYGENAGAFDVKYGLYLPIVNAARLLSLLHAVSESSTLERLRGLRGIEAFPAPVLDDWEESFAIALEFRAKTDCRFEESCYASGGMLMPEQLNSDAKRRLKQALHIAKQLQKTVIRKTEQAEIAGW
jgi:CBS domain-containing protein